MLFDYYVSFFNPSSHRCVMLALRCSWNRRLGHFISFGTTLTMMMIYLIYTIYKTRTRRGGKCHKFGPLIMLIFAIMFIMADLTRHVGQDLGYWSLPMYQHGCPHESFKCLSPIGWLFTCFTYIGFILLSVSTMWTVDIISKIRRKYQELRNN